MSKCKMKMFDKQSNTGVDVTPFKSIKVLFIHLTLKNKTSVLKQ
jgi:hypothetical protein